MDTNKEFRMKLTKQYEPAIPKLDSRKDFKRIVGIIIEHLTVSFRPSEMQIVWGNSILNKLYKEGISSNDKGKVVGSALSMAYVISQIYIKVHQLQDAD